MEPIRENIIPTEILEVMPSGPNEQLNLASKITLMAFESLVPHLEKESVQLKGKISQRNGLIMELKERLLQLDRDFRETDGQLRLALEENVKVCKERDSMAQITKKLCGEMEKLELFKRRLVHTLNDDNPHESIDIMPCGSTKCLTPPKQMRMAMTPWHHTFTNQTYAATSPPPSLSVTRRAQIDGKEFFRQARTRLSYEQFGAFLANIKELNAQKQSREETLKKAREIFGLENMDLYLSFHNLLNLNMS